MRLDGSEHDHNSVVDGTTRLLDVLSGTSSEYNCDGLGTDALSHHVVAFVSKLNFFELSASTKHTVVNAVDCGLQDSASGLAHTLQIALIDTASAEQASVSKVLGSQVTDVQLRQNDLGARRYDFIKLVVDDFPLSIHNFLEIIRVLKTNLCAVFFSLKLELEVEADNFGAIGEALGLLLEASV